MAKCDKQKRKFENYRRDYFRGGTSKRRSVRKAKEAGETSGADG